MEHRLGSQPGSKLCSPGATVLSSVHLKLDGAHLRRTRLQSKHHDTEIDELREKRKGTVGTGPELGPQMETLHSFPSKCHLISEHMHQRRGLFRISDTKEPAPGSCSLSLWLRSVGSAHPDSVDGERERRQLLVIP